MSSPFLAASFAARAHRNQYRKDGQTPYVAHAFRAALVVQQVFGIHDAETICIALLHDTIEDTTTDYDDLHEEFGKFVADGVAILSKDSRLMEQERERVYREALRNAPWQVQVCKLADMYDNASESASVGPSHQQRTRHKLNEYFDALEDHLKPEALAAYSITKAYVLAHP